jgi:hypothetical protein
MSPLETAVEKTFKPLAEEIGCKWTKTDDRFEKFLEIKGRTVNVRVYWYFERDEGIFVTLVQPIGNSNTAIEVPLSRLVRYKTGQEDGPDIRLARATDPNELMRVVRTYAVPYLIADGTDIRAVADWARQRVLQQHPEYAKLKTNKWMRCEWID